MPLEVNKNEFLLKLNKMKTIELAGWKRTNKKLSTSSGGANVVHVRVYLYQKKKKKLYTYLSLSFLQKKKKKVFMFIKKNEVHVKNKQPRSE